MLINVKVMLASLFIITLLSKQAAGLATVLDVLV